jgi:hypothetical protein
MKKVLILLSLIIFGGFLNAQTRMNIYQSNGSVSQIPLSNIDSITYTISNPGNLASLSTLPIGSITASSAVSGGNVTTDGGTLVTENGVCWATLPNPTTANNKISVGSGTGNFTANISGLSDNTIYYVRAYAINSAGTAYGNELSFTTTSTGGGGSNYTVPSTYVYTDGNGNNTVDFFSETQRMDMLSEMYTYLKTANQVAGVSLSESTLHSMYDNSYQGWQDQSLLSSSKQLKSKTANSPAIMMQFETWMSEAANKVSDGSNYHQSVDGKEWTQLIGKGLMGACFAYQITESLLTDNKIGASIDNLQSNLTQGEYYTHMEQHWDEAYGYFTDAIDYPTNGTDRFWGKYANKSYMQGIGAEIAEAFRTGRAAITASRLAGGNGLAYHADVLFQRDILINKFHTLVAGMAIHYLYETKGSVAAQEPQTNINHDLSEAYAFMYGMHTLNGGAWASTIGGILSNIDADFVGYSANNAQIDADIQTIANLVGIDDPESFE